MNHYSADYLAARLSILEFGRSRLSRLGALRPLAGFRAWQEGQRALRDLERLGAHLRTDIGLTHSGTHPPVEDCAIAPATAERGAIAANDNAAAEAA